MYKIILAVRFLIRRRIAYLAVFAVALCVFMVVVVMTVMTGLVRDFKVKNHNWVGDCVLSSDSMVGFSYYEEFVDILENADFVEAVSPVIKSYALFRFGESEHNSGIELMGIDAERHCRVTNFGDTIHYHKGSCTSVFEPEYDPNFPGGVLGIDMVSHRDELGRYRHRDKAPAFCFSISCFPLTARGGLAKAGLGLVNTKTFYYSDSSHSGLAKVDGSFVYLPFDDAQTLCGMGMEPKRVNAIHIRFKPGGRGGSRTARKGGYNKVKRLWEEFVEKKTEAKAKQANLLEKVRVESWKGYRREMIAPVEKEQVMMMAAFGMIGIITVFIVFVVFYMIVRHKSKDIGILKSIGIAKGDIVKLFLCFAFLVGVLGSAIGATAGVVFLTRINQIERWLYDHYGFQVWDRMFYAIDDIPNEIEFGTMAVIIGSAIFACLLGAVVPSWQAARLKPVESLRVGQL